MIRDGYSRLKLGIFERITETTSRLRESTPIANDIIEKPEKYVVVFDAPGAKREDIQVTYKGGRVLLRITRDQEEYPDHYHRYSGRRAVLEGEASLPADANVDPDVATATLQENGSLTVSLPKRS